jgi:hypothetical protein
MLDDDVLLFDDNAKGRIWHWLFMVVLCSPFRAQKAHALFADVGCFLLMVADRAPGGQAGQCLVLSAV